MCCRRITFSDCFLPVSDDNDEVSPSNLVDCLLKMTDVLAKQNSSLLFGAPADFDWLADAMNKRSSEGPILFASHARHRPWSILS